jgi:hypothetical protein
MAFFMYLLQIQVGGRKSEKGEKGWPYFTVVDHFTLTDGLIRYKHRVFVDWQQRKTPS